MHILVDNIQNEHVYRYLQKICATLAQGAIKNIKSVTSLQVLVTLLTFFNSTKGTTGRYNLPLVNSMYTLF